MNNLKIELIDINELKEYENNAKIHTDAQVADIILSITDYGFNDPIAVDKDNVIIEGHGRLMAAKKMGMKELPIIRLDHLTDTQKNEYILAHNKTTLNTGFDFDKLKLELDSITEDLDEEELNNFTMSGFTSDEIESILDGIDPTLPVEKTKVKNKYTAKVDIPHYKPTLEESPPFSDMLDTTKTDELIKEINEKEIPEDIKEFLIQSAYRHTIFDFHNIAEYYAHAEKNIQELMEKSALVIIDFNSAVKNGFTLWLDEIETLVEEDDSNDS